MGVELTGSLADLGFGDVLTLLVTVGREGVLELWNLPGGTRVELHIREGTLHCLTKNGISQDAIHVKPLLLDLLNARKGAFEFHTRRMTECRKPLGWPLERILLSANAEHDEERHHHANLPEANLRYALKRGVSLPRHAFLQSSEPFFLRKGGASAKEVARKLDLPLDRVRYLMLKMIRKGWLEPAEDPPDTNWEVYRQPFM